MVEDLIIFFIGLILILVLISGLLVAYRIIVMWFIFKKAGEEGWKSIIPVYNLITLYRIIGLSPYLIFIYCATFIPIIGTCVPLTMSIIEYVWLGKAFKKEPAFIVGMVFVPAVFLGILAFGKSEYALNNSEKPIEVK